jgi:hypothetical protein|tara:strand:+ start:735 stop:1004 length:270 start_codon:yes stop_codon:yes gene_type:complete
MTFVEQLKQANDATLAATMYNAQRIAGQDVPQDDIAQAIRVATALQTIDQCKPLIRERIREQGPDGTMMECVMREHATYVEDLYAPTRN